MWYNLTMKILTGDFATKFRSIQGDETISIPDELIINGLNWAFKSLPSVSKLYKAWVKHYTMNLDANGHYKWKIKKGTEDKIDFQDIVKFEYMNFFTSTGGDPCPLNVCYRHNTPFYKKNGLPELKVAGKPCEYTREREGDEIYLVLDRPSNVPIIVDYVCYGRPMPVSSMQDVFECPAVVENLIMSALRRVVYQEADDFAFAADIASYLDNKEVVEAIQELTREDSNDTFTILGEAGL